MRRINAQRESKLLANLIGRKELNECSSIDLHLIIDNQEIGNVSKKEKLKEMELTNLTKLETLLKINKDFIIEEKQENEQNNDFLSLIDL